MNYFFFQAEDGIRNGTVTGVQTCALPIWRRRRRRAQPHDHADAALAQPAAVVGAARGPAVGIRVVVRSEERRVGKECRSLGEPYHSKKNNKERSTSQSARIFCWKF